MKNTQGLISAHLVKKNKDQFKPLFCESSFYFNHQTQFQFLNSLWPVFSLNDLTTSGPSHSLNTTHLLQVQNVIRWTITLVALRRPLDWFAHFSLTDLEKFQKNTLLSKEHPIAPLDKPYDIFLKLKIFWPVKLSKNLTWGDFLASVRLKPLPQVAHQALLACWQNKYPLKILNYEPSPLELLSFQCQGIRILTFEENFLKWPQKLYGHRDPLSFWLHDFIHAEHFFKQPEFLQLQIGFYRWVYEAYAAGFFSTLLEHSPAFEKEFHYLISDMNSHPLHLVKTLRALLEIHAPESLLWTQFIEPIKCQKPQLYEALQYVNTALFRPENYDSLIQYLNGLGAQSYSIKTFVS